MKKLFALMMVLVLGMSVMVGCGKKVKLTILETEYITEDYAIAVAKDNEELYNKINTALQELIQQKKTSRTIVYRLAGESGPDHDKQFRVELLLDGQIVGCGTGSSKKRAEQDAAKAALEKLS